MLHRLLAAAIATALIRGTTLAQTAPSSTCIAILLPSVQGVEGSATEVAGTVRDLFTSYLGGPSLRIVPLDSRLTVQAVDEARDKHCGHILIATLTRKHAGGGLLGKALGQAAGTAAWHVPGGGSVGTAVARGAAEGAGQAAATMAMSTRAKDELQLEYRIGPLDGAVKAQLRTEKAKAQVDREDLLTPLVERAATAIVAAVSQK